MVVLDPAEYPVEDIVYSNFCRELGTGVVEGVAFVLDSNLGDVFFGNIMDFHIAVHFKGENPDEVGVEWSTHDWVPDGAEGSLGVGEAWTHFFFADDKTCIVHTRGDVPPATDG